MREIIRAIIWAKLRCGSGGGSVTAVVDENGDLTVAGYDVQVDENGDATIAGLTAVLDENGNMTFEKE